MSIATQTSQIAALLTAAGNAHHQYEQTELQGVYDQEWPEWYARYCLKHGLNSLLAHPLTLEACRDFLQQSYRSFQSIKVPQSWADYTATHFTAQYGG